MIYLDSAATTFQKPAAVRRAVLRAMQTMSSPGRGGYAAARAAEEMLFRCRSAAAELFSVPSGEQIVFTTNATHALNIAIRSLVGERKRVAVSGYEHNAVTRMLHARDAEVIVAAAPLFCMQEAVDAFARAIELGAQTVICTQVSNVFGNLLPIEEIAQLCQRADVPLIVDASQSAGVLPLDFAALGALTFCPVPEEKFPCFAMARQAIAAGGTRPLVYTVANETAVNAFLSEKITFTEIADFVRRALEKIPERTAKEYAALAEIREEHFDTDAVLHIGTVNQFVGLRELTPCIKGENPGILPDFHHHIRYCLVLVTEAGGQCRPAGKLTKEKLKILLRSQVNELLIYGDGEGHLLLRRH